MGKATVWRQFIAVRLNYTVSQKVLFAASLLLPPDSDHLPELSTIRSNPKKPKEKEIPFASPDLSKKVRSCRSILTVSLKLQKTLANAGGVVVYS